MAAFSFFSRWPTATVINNDLDSFVGEWVFSVLTQSSCVVKLLKDLFGCWDNGGNCDINREGLENCNAWSGIFGT